MSAAVSMAADVGSSSTTVEAMTSPSVTIAPVRPWAYAKEDPVIEVARPIKTHGCARVRRIVIVAVRADGRIYADDNSCVGRWHQGQRDEHSCCTGQKQTAHCEFVNYLPDFPHFVILRNSRFSIRKLYFQYQALARR
jgi:hypothetical protein